MKIVIPNYTAAIIIRDKKILLLQRNKNDDEPEKWTPINETIEDNESPEDAVVRGVKEEIGTEFLITERLENHLYDGITAVFLGTVTGPIRPEQKEVKNFGWFSYEETKSLDFAYKYECVINQLFEKKLLR